MVISGREDHPPARSYPSTVRDRMDPHAEMDEFDSYNRKEMLEQEYSKYYLEQNTQDDDDDIKLSLSSMNRISRMGEGLMTRMQETFNTDYLKSMLSSFSKSDGYSDGYGCCDGLDFNTFVPGFVLVAVSYALLFLLNATVTSGRRKRMVTSSEKEEESKF